VYPEGHRMQDRNTPGPLKKGMIKYAFERKIDVQIVQVFGIE
jgi:1-acyl-sn-glycerol-3-phosphate acyltransferase